MQSQYENIIVTPLGAGQEVGRSCIVCKIKDRTIIFDSGIHMQYSDMNKYPDFKFICGEGNINDFVDVVIITHFHLDHCGSLPYLTQHFKYQGPIYATMPTKAMIPYMLEDYRKVNADIKKQKDQNVYIYTASQAKLSAEKITSVALQQTVKYKDIKITPYYAGHVLGAAMFYVEYDGLSIMYTGDYNSYADRHLGAAVAPRLNPNIIITETTYATTIRDTKRDRQRKMLKIVSETVQNGGKVLIPVFALGRAQELSVLLQTYWNRTQSQIPVYFSAGLIQKANFYYKLFVQWQNQKIKQDFLQNNLFNFKKVKVFDKALIRADTSYVLFATPGMLHGGTSLQVFKQWCGNPKNTIIIPGYCVPGTFGNKLLNNVKKLEIDYKEYEVNMKVENISFSAHADAKGIINLIRFVGAENIVFVHGDKQKMKIFQGVVKEQLNKPVFRPGNKQPTPIRCSVRKQISIKESGSFPKQASLQGCLLNKKVGDKESSYFKFISEQNILKELNLMKDMLGCSHNHILEQSIQAQFIIKDEKMLTNLINEREVRQLNSKNIQLINHQHSQPFDQPQTIKIQQKEENLEMKDQNQEQLPQKPHEARLKGDSKKILQFLQLSKA